MSVRDQIVKAMNAAANRIQRWLTIYFPEYLKVYKGFDSVSGLAVLWQAPLPEDVVKLGADGIVELWHEKKLRAVGKKEGTDPDEEQRAALECPVATVQKWICIFCWKITLREKSSLNALRR